MPIRLAPLVLVLLWVQSLAAKPSSGSFQFDFDPHSTYTFDGVVGERILANNTGWLILAPAANPGLLAMFRLRDRQPPPDLMPWAGEFVGKFLISAVQSRRMMDDPKRDAVVETVIQELIACQAQDGYPVKVDILQQLPS